VTRVFGHGALRLVLLSLLEDGPKHGYELIVALEDRFMGMYRPSSGTVYPRLAALEEEGLVSATEEDGRRLYALTDAGRDELARRRSEIDDTVTSAASAIRTAMEGIQAEIRAAVAGVQAEVGQAVAEARRGVSDAVRSPESAAGQAWRVGDQARKAAVDEAKRVRRAAEDLRRQAAYEAGQARDRSRSDPVAAPSPPPPAAPPASPAPVAAPAPVLEPVAVPDPVAPAGPGVAASATDAVRAAAASAAGAAEAVRSELEDLLADLSGWVGEAGDLVRRHMPDESQRARLRVALDEARRAFLETLGTDSSG
jgi:DNA-binding PadR family transcriptional regulator